ncbi:MAG: hypothetical protein IT166_03340 [Bryobacterales bacterium]|nr:hypothetical protein [Bryobacterales bacterium]
MGSTSVRENDARPVDVLRMFGVKATLAMLALGKAALRQQSKVYYFDRPAGKAVDISNLDCRAVLWRKEGSCFDREP